MGADDVDLIVASDAEQILGIGDWGVGGGAGIAAGKLAVYTAAAGIDPARVIPVALDVGTDNEQLLNDPFYVGNRHARVRGQRYDDFIEAYVTAATRMFPNAMLHWEDFGPSNARRILEKYTDRVPTFNDDMQGTGAIVLAADAGRRAASAGTPLRDQRIVVFGAGTAGIGIADQMRDAMVRDGLDRGDGHPPDLGDRQAGPADRRHGRSARLPGAVRPAGRRGRRLDAGRRRHPARRGRRAGQADHAARHLHRPRRLHREVVRAMAAGVDRPIIFPISNPTERIEAMPADLIRWTDGRALVATGIPVDPITYNGVTYAIGQANNALLYPGLGLGAIVVAGAPGQRRHAPGRRRGGRPAWSTFHAGRVAAAPGGQPPGGLGHGRGRGRRTGRQGGPGPR